MSTHLGPDLRPTAVVAGLGHVMVVGGTFAQWDALGPERWDTRVEELGATVAAAGATWLTLRAYEAGPDPVPLERWTRVIATSDARRCTVIVDPCADGRGRFVEAMAALAPEVQVNETTVASALYDPADCEPDLVLILGPETRLPPSLVWELAYAELVFIDVPWHALAPAHLQTAIADFASRRRRFGGLDG